MQDAPPSLEGRRIAGRYTVGPQIGAGGMGTVYRATQDVVGREVAIKVVSAPGAAGYEAVRQRFHREAKSIARLSGRRTVVLHDTGEEADGLLYIVMELVPGTTLRAVLRAQGRLPPARALSVAMQVLEALDEAHRQGILHRDIKPSNVMTELDAEGIDHVKVLDFGIAKLFGVDERDALTASSETPGTARYMAPEQIRGGLLSPATDVYAVGCLLYEMLTGEAPFSGETRFEVQMGHISAAVPPLPEGVGPPGIWAVLVRALAKAPEERYGDAAAMRRALRELRELNGEPVDDRSSPGETPMPRAPLAPSPTPVTSAAPPMVDRTMTAGGEADQRRAGLGETGPTDRPPPPIVDETPPGRAETDPASPASGPRRALLVAVMAAAAIVAAWGLMPSSASDPTPALSAPAPAPVADPTAPPPPVADPTAPPPPVDPTAPAIGDAPGPARSPADGGVEPTPKPGEPRKSPPVDPPAPRPRPPAARASGPPTEPPLHFEVPHTLQD